MPKEDQIPLANHLELYWVAKHLKDLKYDFDKNENFIAGPVLRPNPYWRNVFYKISRYLSWPEPGKLDHILSAFQRFTKEGLLLQAIEILFGLYHQL